MLRNTVVALVLSVGAWQAYAAGPSIVVYKTPTCGCCGKWVEHLKTNGFQPEVREVVNTAEVRKQNGVPDNLLSCHTAVINGYSIEGHVPAQDIQRLIKEKPKAKGLAVPGMPHGSPGMETGRVDPYSVLLFKEDGSTTVFRKVSPDGIK